MRKAELKKRIPVKNIVLRTLAASGALSLALLAPNAISLLKYADRPRNRRNELYRRITQAISKLEASGLVVTTGERGRRSVRLAPKGQRALDSIFAREYQILEPAFWDGKWRILTFDMRESRRKARNTLRILLRNTGFVRLQDSVWIYPYRCDEFVELVRAHLKSGTGELQYFVAEALESDQHLRNHFKLL